MPTALIIGSGPAAAGAALALTADPAQHVTVIDAGATLEPDLRSAVGRLATTAEGSWSPGDVERIGLQPVPAQRGALPQKRVHGSDFPFRDVGQLDGHRGARTGQRVGGLRRLRRLLQRLGCPNHALFQGHVRPVADHAGRDGDPLPHSSGRDDAGRRGGRPRRPLPAAGSGTPPAASVGADRTRPRPVPGPSGSRPVARHHPRQGAAGLQGRGVHPVRPVHDRLSLRAHLLELAHLRPAPDREADQLPGRTCSPSISTRSMASHRCWRGTPRRAGSNAARRPDLRGLWWRSAPPGWCSAPSVSSIEAVYLQESVQFVMPTVSLRPVPRPSRRAQLHPQPVQPARTTSRARGSISVRSISTSTTRPSFESLPGRVAAPASPPRARTALLRRVSVGLGYVPGWGSPRVKVVARRASGGKDQLPVLEIDGERGRGWPPMLRALVRIDAQGRPRPRPVAGRPDDLGLGAGEELSLRRQLPPRADAAAGEHGSDGTSRRVGPHPPGGRVGLSGRPRHDLHLDDHGERPPHRQRDARGP